MLVQENSYSQTLHACRLQLSMGLLSVPPSVAISVGVGVGVGGTIIRK